MALQDILDTITDIVHPLTHLDPVLVEVLGPLIALFISFLWIDCYRLKWQAEADAEQAKTDAQAARRKAWLAPLTDEPTDG